VKEISGNRISGRSVPGICKNSKKSDILIRGRKSRKAPMATSHHPRIGTKSSGENQ
jgi:hypothetical protein